MTNLNARCNVVFRLACSFYLLGNLAKVADVSQNCAFNNRVLSILPAFLSIEVRMEGVHTFYSSRALLPVPENQVNPQVEVGTHVVTFQGLRETMQEMYKLPSKVILQNYYTCTVLIITVRATPSVKLLI